MKPRLRFAPSPTGHLHIGGARTALYNWLISKKTKGIFVLRIEDTDRERSTQEYVQSILEAMKWLGLDWDEGPFYQTERSEIYRKHLEILIDQKKAYRCYCRPEELEARRLLAQKEGRKPKYEGQCRSIDPKNWEHDPRPYCLRFKAPESGSTVVEDLIRGRIEFQNTEMDDLVLARTDGSPTYNFCVVVDDVTMNITHVIRGDDHLNNTPRQMLLYKAFNYPVPAFAHVPMILGADKVRLSKRHGATSVLAFRDLGFLPEALLNYLARLGWSYKDQEIFSRTELIECFDIASVGKSPAVFDWDKLTWLNGHYLREKSPESLIPEVKRLFLLEQIDIKDEELLSAAITASKEKVKTLKELAEIIRFVFVDSIHPDEKAKTLLEDTQNRGYLEKLAEELSKLTSWNKENIQQASEKLVEQFQIKLKDLAQPARAAIAGTTISIGIYEAMLLLGKNRVIERLLKQVR